MNKFKKYSWMVAMVVGFFILLAFPEPATNLLAYLFSGLVIILTILYLYRKSEEVEEEICINLNPIKLKREK